MRALFVHSARFLRTPDGRVYSNSQFPYECWSRYLKHFDGVTVVCRMSHREEAPENWNLSSGPGVTFAGTVDDHGQFLMQLESESKLRIIRREMDECNGVIVRQSDLGWLAAREAQRRGIPWAVEVVGDAWDAYWNYGTLLGKLYAPIAWWRSRYWIGQAAFAIYVTREYLQKKYPCRGVSFGASDVQINEVSDAVLEQRISRSRTEPGSPEGADTRGVRSFASNVEINPVPSSVLDEKIVRLYSKSRDVEPLVIGLIGSLFTSSKGLSVALRALRRLKAQGQMFKLRVLGDGHHDYWRHEARRLCVDDLLCLDGFLPNGDPVMKWLDNLDIYIQPSFQEGLPRALIEAMSRGLPALGSTCGGIPELLSSECLHRPGDDRALAGQLLRMAKDKAWQIQQAERNFEEAQNYYKTEIESRRNIFWGQFAEAVRKKSCGHGE